MNIFEPLKRKRRPTKADKNRVAATQDWKCANKKCRTVLPTRFEVDRKTPVSEGGSDRASNLQALCPNCHAKKTDDDRHRKKQRRIREAEKKEKDPFGLSSIFRSSRSGKSKSPFDVSIGGPKPRRKRVKSPFDIF